MSAFNERNCREVDPELMYPNDNDRQGLARAKAICSGCPAQGPCLELAMDTEASVARFGVFGGLSPRQRGNLGRARKAA